MKTYITILGLLLSFTVIADETKTTLPYQEEYLAGIEYFEEGQMRAASDSFLEAIRLEPSPGVRPGEYLPYIYLSATQFEMGHTLEARDALIQSQVFGVASKTETGKLLLGRYAVDIMSAPLDNRRYTAAPPPKPAEKQLASLSESNTVSMSESKPVPISEQTVRRCAKASKQPDNNLPWHFHYKCGVDLMEAGEPKQAVDSFLMGANTHQDPARSKRMYGMWYIDYLPYYQIALAHSRLGDWEKAQNAIETSASFEEFAPTDPDYQSFTELNQLIKRHLQSNDS